MNVLVVGLGLIGGAYAKRLTAAGYEVFGFDKNLNTLDYALKNNYCSEVSSDETCFVKKADLIILALYPRDITSFLKKNQKYFNNKQIITDVCGIKGSFINEATSLSLPAEYLSHHPMAGKEKSGIIYSGLVNFSDANFLITPTVNTKNSSINTLKKVGLDLDFRNIFVISVKEHDKMIAYTSQLTHAIAVSLVNADSSDETKKFIGDSYRDLTRIAKINENLWTELFIDNKESLLEEINSFSNSLNSLKTALENDDECKLKELFNKSRRIRSEMEK